MLVWNVARNRFFRGLPGFQQVIAAIDADLLILDEMHGDTSAIEIAEALEPVAGGGWQALYSRNGGHQRVSILAKQQAVELREFHDLEYPPELQQAWIDQNDWVERGLREGLANGVPVLGARMSFQGRRLLVVGLDLHCCGDTTDSWQEQRRCFETMAIRQALIRAHANERPDAIIVAGDFNNVQGMQPVENIAGRHDAQDAGPMLQLEEVPARHRDGIHFWTWDGRGTPYPSSRLDRVLHNAGLKVLQSQVFDTESLTPDELRALGLSAEMSRELSDHRPVVVDFAWVE